MEEQRKEERRSLLLGATYGSTASRHEEDVEEDTTTADGEEDDEFADLSFHLGRSKIGHSNVWTSMRFTESFADYGDEYEKVPTMLEENITLVLDPNLDPTDKGKLYYSEEAFYNTTNEPHYALTVNVDIYQRIVKEVNDSRSVPFGLYFCCHGGDSAHVGASSDDFVDIKLAWMLISSIFLAMCVVAAL